MENMLDVNQDGDQHESQFKDYEYEIGMYDGIGEGLEDAGGDVDGGDADADMEMEMDAGDDGGGGFDDGGGGYDDD